MTTKFDHAVIYNGKFYPANTPIEVDEEKPVDQATPETAGVEQTEAPKPKTEKAVKNGRKSTGRKPKSKPAD